MTQRPYIQYLNPSTGKYESPILPDVGDVNELSTSIKTNIVAAINSMIENGVPSSEINEKLGQLEEILARMKNGEWTAEQLASLVGSVESIIEIPLTEFQLGLDAQKALWDAEVGQKLEDAKEDYNDRLEQTERVLTDASGQLDLSRGTLEQARTDLNNMTLNVSGYEERFNELDNSLETVVFVNKFDLMTTEFIQNKKVSIETAEGIIETTISQVLSAQDGRVTRTESDYTNLTSELSKKITYEELKGELDEYEFAKYGDNLLEGTRDFRDWTLNGSILSAGTAYKQAKSVTLLSSARQIDHILLDLEVGKTYTVSLAYYYEGTGNPIPVMRTEGDNYELTEIYEDTRQFNNWMVVYTQFVAEAENQDVSFFVNNIPLGDDVKLACLKVEYGIKSSPWKPHINDTWYELELYDSRFIVQANTITSWLRKIAGDDDETIDQEALWQVTAEGLLGQARTAKKLEDGTYQQETADLVMDSERFSVKVGKTVSDGISEINVDNKNRIINSNFLFEFEQWQNVNPQFQLEKIESHNYAMVSKSGLSANNPISLKTNKFKVMNGENLMIGVSVYTPNKTQIDVKTIMRLELFDINDIRVGFKDITIDEMTGQIVNLTPSRLTTKYKVDNTLVAKGQITLQLPRNGHIGFSQLSVQNSDININEWAPAPEDIMMLQLRMDTWIEQDAESVAIGAIRQEIEKGKEDDTSAFHEMWAQIKVTADNFDLSVKRDGIVQSINGSSEGLKIDFEKVNITGELIAGLMSAQYLDVSKGFRIMNGNFPILQANSNGEVILNLQKLTINALSVLTEGDRPDLEKSIADELETKIKPYVHLAYADNADGTKGFTFVEGNKAYMGIYSDYTDVISSSPNRYLWSRIKGEETFTAYATSATGANFSKEPFDDATYIGFHVGAFVSDNPLDYEWLKAKGDDSYKVEVHSMNGDAFKNGIIDTWIYALVYEGHKDITSTVNLSRFKWKRTSDDPTADQIWNDRYAGGATEIHVTKEDVYHRATFSCEITN